MSRRLAIILTLQSDCAGCVRIRSSVPESTNVQWYIAQLKARVGRKGMRIVQTDIIFTSNYDGESADTRQKVSQNRYGKDVECVA